MFFSLIDIHKIILLVMDREHLLSYIYIYRYVCMCLYIHLYESVSVFVCINVCIHQHLHVYSRTSSNFKQILNSNWFKTSFPSPTPTIVSELSLSYYLSIAGRGILCCIPLLRLLTLWEMRTSSSQFWTGFALSFSLMLSITQRGPPLK